MLGPETSDVCLIRLCLDETKGNGVKHDQWGGVERVQCQEVLQGIFFFLPLLDSNV